MLCFPSSSDKPGSSSRDLLSEKPNGLNPAACPFCHIPPSSEPSTFKVVLESDQFVAFHDSKPQAKIHLLTVTRDHIGSIRELRGERGAELVQQMQAFGARALDIASHPESHPDPSEAHLSTTVTRDRISEHVATSTPRRFGFHIPPFNSVDHLHLHCLQSPLSFRGKFKYHVFAGSERARPPTIKGWGWFVTADQASQILRAKRRVRVGVQSGYSTIGGNGAREVGGVPGKDYRKGMDRATATLSD